MYLFAPLLSFIPSATTSIARRRPSPRTSSGSRSVVSSLAASGATARRAAPVELVVRAGVARQDGAGGADPGALGHPRLLGGPRGARLVQEDPTSPAAQRLRRWAGRLGRVTAFLALAVVGLTVALVRGL